METSSPTGKINTLHEQTIAALEEQIDCLALPFNTDEEREIIFKRIESLLLILKTLVHIP